MGIVRASEYILFISLKYKKVVQRLQEAAVDVMAALVCGAVVFPGLFFSFVKIFKTYTQWSYADVVSVSERSEASFLNFYF